MVPRGWVTSALGTSSRQGASPALYGLLALSGAAVGNGFSAFLCSSLSVLLDSMVFDFLVNVLLFVRGIGGATGGGLVDDSWVLWDFGWVGLRVA